MPQHWTNYWTLVSGGAQATPIGASHIKARETFHESSAISKLSHSFLEVRSEKDVYSIQFTETLLTRQLGDVSVLTE